MTEQQMPFVTRDEEYLLQPTDEPPPASRLSLPRRFLRFGARLAHRYAGAPTPSQDLRELIRRVGPDLIAIDRTVAESGRLVPNKAFAVYQKRRGAGAAS